MIAFGVKAAIVTALVVLGVVILWAVAARLFVAVAPMLILWNLKRKSR